jgi:hypothetical protein
VLAESFLEQHPSGRVTAVVVDDDDASERWREEPFEALAPAALGLSAATVARLRLVYEAGPYACALKPHMLRLLVTRGTPAVHLDADCFVLGDLSPLAGLAAEHGVVLTAHSLTVAPPDAELSFVREGTFNAGVLAASPRALPFLDWWADRCEANGLTDPPPETTWDQVWLALVPTLFDHHVLRDPGVNVTGWSLHDRDVTWDGDLPSFAGEPLRCFHLCGSFDPSAPLDYHPDGGRPELGASIRERPGAARICEAYASRLLAAGGGESHDPAYRFGQLPDGTRLTPLMRRLYQRAVVGADGPERPPPDNPFLSGDAEPFLRWLRRPVAAGGALSHYLAALRDTRPDVVAAFPAPTGRDEAGYLRWVAEAAARGEIDVPDTLLPGAGAQLS